MGDVVAIGEQPLVEGYALAGVLVVQAEDPAQVLRAWRDLPAAVSLVILTAAAARALPDEVRRGGPLTAVMPA